MCIVQQVTAAGGREEGFGALTVHSPYAMCPEVSASALTDSRLLGRLGGFYKCRGGDGKNIGDLDLSKTSNSFQGSPGG